jgi:serine/threonine-protein kinase SRPK3
MLVDLTSHNILLRLKAKVNNWSDERVYEVFGVPDTYEVEREDYQPLGTYAPPELVENIPAKVFVDADILGEDAVIIDFGMSFEILNKPSDYRPATAVNYRAPEMRFEDAYTTATEVWSLGCLLFEIRSGAPFFDTWFCTDDVMVHRIVRLLGKLPEPWWSSWSGRSKFYHESGEPLQVPHERESSIQARVSGIGMHDFESKYREGGGIIERKSHFLAICWRRCCDCVQRIVSRWKRLFDTLGSLIAQGSHWLVVLTLKTQQALHQ